MVNAFCIVALTVAELKVSWPICNLIGKIFVKLLSKVKLDRLSCVINQITNVHSEGTKT